jgi:DNA-binding transcriptional ArsR family regulator
MSRRPPERTLRRGPSGTSARVFAALGDRRRLRILTRLSAEGPLSITRLSDASDVSRQAITKHLRVLADAGLVKDRRRGRERVFELEPRPLESARRDLDAISARWDRAIERLRAHVER